MRAINHKLLRDLWHLRGQAAAIALVIACGVATFAMSFSTLDALEATRAAFYQEYHFADVFASLKRAPEHLAGRLRAIPGLDQIETRVVAAANLDVADYPEPVRGLLVSIPDDGQPLLNQLYLVEGHLPTPYRDNEVVVNDGFAEAHGLGPGDQLWAVINGRRKALTIVGVARSPEYVYQLAPGAVIPDFERFGILWMGRTPLATAYDMAGAFNDVTFTLTSGAQQEDVIDRLDLLLAPYGGLGAYGREDQQSHFFLNEEFRQLNSMATVYPIIFLGVAAFLLNIVIGRLIRLQREQIALLKAFGYTNLEVGLHYLGMVSLIVLLGVAVGLMIGAWLGQNLAALYMEYYRFPYLEYRLTLEVLLIAVVVTMGAALVGTLYAVRAAMQLPPAEAMRPEPPQVYRATLVERLGLQRFLAQPTRMIMRHLERRPVKALLSIVGISLGCAIVVMGRFFSGAIDHMVDLQFRLSQRDDLTVTFVEPVSRQALYDLQGLYGVEHAEPFRSVPVRLRFEHRSYRTGIQGLGSGGTLFRLLDTENRPVLLPPEGIVLSEQLGDILGLVVGDIVTVEVLEGSRPVRTVPVARFVRQYVGQGAYMEFDALARLLREGPAISGAYLAIDERYEDELYDRLKGMPRVAGIANRKNVIADFYELMAQNWLIMVLFITILAGAIAFSVVYNSARIALSERGRELASLRVLGFTKGEIAYILLGELAVLTLAAIPLGFLMGWSLSYYLVQNLATELFTIPMIVEPSAYSFAAVVILVSAVASGLLIRRRLSRLDLIAVLKTRE